MARLSFSHFLTRTGRAKQADDWADTAVKGVIPSTAGQQTPAWYNPVNLLANLTGRTVPSEGGSGLTESQALRENATKAQTLRTIANLGLITAGVGAAGAGLYNAGHWLFPDDPVKEENYGAAVPEQIHYPQTPAQAHSPVQKQILKRRGLHKMAQTPPLQPDPITSDWSYPWAIPTAGLSIFLGGLGGAHLMNWLAKSRRKQDVESELEESKKEYEGTLLKEYDPRHLHQLATPGLRGRPKLASAESPLDRVYECYKEKRAWDFLRTAAGSGAGLYGLALLAAGIPAGVLGYQLGARSDSRKVMEDALKERLRIRSAISPMELGFETSPVSVRPGHLKPYDPEAEESELDKDDEETPPLKRSVL